MPGLIMNPKLIIEGKDITSLDELNTLIDNDESSVKVALVSSAEFNHGDVDCKFHGRLRLVPLPNFITYYKNWKEKTS